MFSRNSRFRKLLQAFSTADAIQLYARMKTGARRFYVSDLKMHLHLRPHTRDMETLDEIFGRKLYDVKLPFRPQTILDAGANVGLASLFFQWRYPGARILALEIEEDNFATLQKNIAPFSNIKAIRKGVYAKNCHLAIHDPYGATNSYIVEEVAEARPGSIHAATIDALMQEAGWQYIDLLKMDIEGAEKEVFEGDTTAWLPFVRVMMIETHDRMKRGCSHAIFEAIRHCHFELMTTTEGTLIFVNTDLVPQF